eukprot:3169752-Rhodomonas_salina.1
MALHACYSVRGTDPAREWFVSGTELAYGAVQPAPCTQRQSFWYATPLRACYAMSGTDIANGGSIWLRACYAMPGTDLAYAAISDMRNSAVLTPMLGTEMSYDATSGAQY